jgi:hypothetical protein
LHRDFPLYRSDVTGRYGQCTLGQPADGKILALIWDLLRSQIERILAARAPWMRAEERRVHALVSHVANRAIFAQAIHLKAGGENVTGERLLQQARVMQIACYDHLLEEHEAKTS